MAENPELVMTGLVILIMVFCFAIIWFVFMVPMERGLYKRRMELIKKRLEQNEERLRRQRQEEQEVTGREEKRASGGER
jgi:hypothetical protein